MKKYKVIYADPPWNYKNKNVGTNMQSGAYHKYSLMTTDDICKLNIKKICQKDCVLFLWVTVPFLRSGLRVMNCWGFKYKTMIIWKKNNLGMGYWFRNKVECLLLGIKGKVKAFRSQEQNFIEHKVLKHSEKPKIFIKLINKVTKNLRPKIELFARKKTRKWDTMGLELNNIDIREL